MFRAPFTSGSGNFRVDFAHGQFVQTLWAFTPLRRSATATARSANSSSAGGYSPLGAELLGFLMEVGNKLLGGIERGGEPARIGRSSQHLFSDVQVRFEKTFYRHKDQLIASHVFERGQPFDIFQYSGRERNHDTTFFGGHGHSFLRVSASSSNNWRALRILVFLWGLVKCLRLPVTMAHPPRDARNNKSGNHQVKHRGRQAGLLEDG